MKFYCEILGFKTCNARIRLRVKHFTIEPMALVVVFM